MPRGQTIELASSEEVLQRYESALRTAPRLAQKAAKRALRRTIRTGKAAASREIRKDINLKKKPVDRRIDARIISDRSLVAQVRVRDRRIELIEFMTKAQIASAWKRQNARKSKGVAVKVFKSEGRRFYEGAFVNIGMRDRKWHVLQRDTASRYPIYIKYGPRLIERFERRLGAFAAAQSEVLDKNLDRELRFALGEIGAQ